MLTDNTINEVLAYVYSVCVCVRVWYIVLCEIMLTARYMYTHIVNYTPLRVYGNGK